MVRLYANGGVTEFPACTDYRVRGGRTVPIPAPPSRSLPSRPARKNLIDRGGKTQWPARRIRDERGRRRVGISRGCRFRKGAIGLMQLMPATAREYGADPHDPEQNVEAGTQYLRDLLVKYQHDDHQVSRARSPRTTLVPARSTAITACPPYRETLAYVERVLRSTKSASSRRPIKKFLVDLRRQNKIALRQPVDLVRVRLHVHAAPSQRDVRDGGLRPRRPRPHG